jgi:wyosine [tRNA(Phe)-imidazoG37] synthetase (radical SAM superfamily)
VNYKLDIDRAVIEINGGCNYSCEMCPQSRNDGRPGRDKRFLRKMDLVEFEKNVADCAKHGLRVVNLDGSGEATLCRNLPEYIKIVKKYGAKAYIFSNGFLMKGQFMKDCVDAGLDFFRFSVIGYSSETYAEWMDRPIGGYDHIWNNIIEMQKYVDETKAETVVSTYHLILGDDEEEELKQYKHKHDICPVKGVKTEIWKMHNWSGVYDNNDKRTGDVKTCGRPFSPDVVIRSGGLDGKTGAVAPCCQVLGQDEKAVLGHTSEHSIEEIWNGPGYTQLREDHINGTYPDYCKTCDFLIDDPEVLVYTNDDRSLMHMNGTEFDLNDYRDIKQYLPAL